MSVKFIAKIKLPWILQIFTNPPYHISKTSSLLFFFFGALEVHILSFSKDKNELLMIISLNENKIIKRD